MKKTTAKEAIHLGADHAGYKLKEHIKKFLKKKGYTVKDHGALSYKPTDDYPDYAEKTGKAVAKDKRSKGILFCGSAEGICIAANKIKGIRAVAAWNKITARLSREHNDANILCLAGGRTKQPIPALTEKQAESITETWLNTNFSGEKRHVRRINKIKKLEQ